jgi:hypothetical protein
MNNFFLFSIFLCTSFILSGQKKKSIDDIKYKRNSLSTFIVTDNDFENKDKVLRAYNNYEFPDKYNDHRVGPTNANLTNIILSEEELSEILNELGETKKKYETRTKLGKALYGDSYRDTRLEVYRLKKWISENKIGSMLIDKWYDNNTDGIFDLDLIIERGLFSASKENIDNALAESTIINNVIEGAALDIIPQTYLVFNNISLFSNEVAATYIKDSAMEKIKTMEEGLVKDLAIKGIKKIYKKTSEGYTVWTTVYLFKLKWDKSNQLQLHISWGDKPGFLSKNFEVEHVGTEKANSLVNFSFKKADKGKTADDIINLAIVRNIEKAFSKLTKKHESFKPNVLLAEISPLTAFIGMKEGLKGGETFEVLNEEYDDKTGRTFYKSVGRIKVNKKLIWDNRYFAGEESSSNLDRTTFKGKAKKATLGSLIRQKR